MAQSCLGSPPPNGSFFLASKRNKKCRLKIFLLKLVGVTGTVKPEKFVRPDLSRTEIRCYGLAVWKYIDSTSRSLINNCRVTSMVACRRINVFCVRHIKCLRQAQTDNPYACLVTLGGCNIKPQKSRQI